MRISNFLTVSGMLVVGGALLFAVGCKTGEPGVTNKVGTVTTRLDHQPDAIVTATNKAVEELKLTPVSSTSSKLDGLVIARTAADDKVTITVERETDAVSQVWIRVGKAGDQDMSMTILDKIRKNLTPIQRVLP